MAGFADDVLTRGGHIQSSLFPWLREEVDPITAALERLIIVLDSIGLESFLPGPPRGGRGRKPDDRRALARAFVAKVVLDIPTTAATIERLAIDRSLRRICGWERARDVPSEATFSRAFAEFAASELPQRMHEALVKRTLGDRIVGCVARDATEIEAREKPAKPGPGPGNRAEPPPDTPPNPPPRKRGRPRKGEERPKTPTRLERQAKQSLSEMLAELPIDGDVGTKQNAKGFRVSWIGYKLHSDVADGQIPVACLLTAASVHDSQVAIPLMTLTGQRTTYLYDLMDAAYDAQQIAEHSLMLGHVPVIDINFRTDADAKAEHKAEARRRAILNIPDPDDPLYTFRTMVEQADAYAGFGQLYEPKRSPGPIAEAACWAHGRRKFFELADIARAATARSQKNPVSLSPLALEAVRRIDQIFDLERDLNGRPEADRLALRQAHLAPPVKELETWMREERSRLSRHNPVAKAMDYMLTRWPAFARFLDDGKICLTNNAAERALRCVAVGRKNWTFCGSDRGGDRAATIYTLIATAKLNDVDPEAWLADVLRRINDHPSSRLAELLPWNWNRQALDQAQAA